MPRGAGKAGKGKREQTADISRQKSRAVSSAWTWFDGENLAEVSEGDNGDRMVHVQTAAVMADMKTKPHTLMTLEGRAVNYRL